MRILDAGDSAILIEHDAAALRGLAAWLAREPLPAQVDLHPGWQTLLVRYDCLRADPQAVREELEHRCRHLAAWTSPPPQTHDVTVRFGGEAGPDLEELAAARGLHPRAVVERFTRGVYTVAFLGFAPGFAYLGGLDACLATPRRPTPRPGVPAGSVAIGGAHAAIYPQATPGGWNLIGRTEAVLFDASRTPPATLAAGDRVRFHDADEV